MRGDTPAEVWPPEGDPTRHLALDELLCRLDRLEASPKTSGRLSLLVRRIDEAPHRDVLDGVRLTCEGGLAGDRWSRRQPFDPEAQLSVVQTPIATLIANGQALSLSGDNLVVDLDLSRDNLPIGSRLQIGNVLAEVTPKPHNGCKKFRARFGDGALRLVSLKERRHLNLRGIFVRVIEPGEVQVGAMAEVVSRG